MVTVFDEPGYLQHDAARLSHLASLGLSLVGRSILIVGAGPGNHAAFYARERGCRVEVTDARSELVRETLSRYAAEVAAGWLNATVMDVERPGSFTGRWDVVHCYGLLYHLGFPGRAIANMSAWGRDLLLLETCVAGDDEVGHQLMEDPTDPRNGVRGIGSRMTRAWIARELRQWYDHVYFAILQPRHEEFPLDWRVPLGPGNHRAVFVASRRPLDLLEGTTLCREIPTLQEAIGWS